MARMQSFDIEQKGKERHSSSQFSANTARTYLMFGLALFVIYGIGKMILPADNSDDEFATKGDAAGGWGAEHNHPVSGYGGKYSSSYGGTTTNSAFSTPVTKYQQYQSESVPTSSIDFNKDMGLELRESDLLMVISPIVSIPSHSRPEYEKYQDTASFDLEDVLYDTQTPHGMAFDFMLNRDKRPINHDDDSQLTQRFVLTLLFYSTGGKDDDASSVSEGGNGDGRTSGWDASMAHFLTGLHECHWVKKSMEDQFWGLLSLEGDSDRRVGVTKCNSDMEVTEIRLADLNLVGFIPEEIKYLGSLESLDIQNNHLAGPIPESLGELDELRYLSLDGNNFSGTIPDVFDNLMSLERAYLNFNDFNGAMPTSLCTLREEGALKDLWSDCGGYPITCTCCTVCCDMVAECNEMESQRGD